MKRTLLQKFVFDGCMGFLIVALVTACGGTPTPTRVATTAPAGPTKVTEAVPTQPVAQTAPTAAPAGGAPPPTAAAGTQPSGDKGQGPSFPAQRDAVFVPDHVMITGQPGAISAVLDYVQAQTFAKGARVVLQPVETLSLGAISPASDKCGDAMACFQKIKGGVIALYQIRKDGFPLSNKERELTAAAIAKINERGKADCVFADPIYPTGRPIYPTQGDPWIAEGSPWIAEGSPWNPNGGSPPPAITNADVALAEASFQAQWAFTSTISPGTVGIGLVDSAPGLPRQTNQGAGIRVGIFDTSPVIQPALNVTWTTRPWSFQIYTPTVTASLSGYTVTLPPNSPDLKDHGLFSAGLVHAVAPNSQIQLYRVLDDYARGNVWVLNAALVNFMTDALGSAPDLRGVVLNISLGLRPEKGGSPDLPDEVQSLKYLVTAAYCQGMVVVAASGNDSAAKTANHAPPEPRAMPALFSPAAIAVAASNKAGLRACYSNDGDIAAPGGETKGGCSGTYDEFSLVGPVMMSDRFPWGYAYWAGSSFATPLVSGLAALGAASWLPGRWVTQGEQLPNEVRSGINGSAAHPLSADPNRNPPGGIIRVR